MECFGHHQICHKFTSQVLYVTLYCREVVYEDLFVKLENFPGILQEKKVHTFCVLLDGVFILDWFFASGNS